MEFLCMPKADCNTNFWNDGERVWFRVDLDAAVVRVALPSWIIETLSLNSILNGQEVPESLEGDDDSGVHMHTIIDFKLEDPDTIAILVTGSANTSHPDYWGGIRLSRNADGVWTIKERSKEVVESTAKEFKHFVEHSVD